MRREEMHPGDPLPSMQGPGTAVRVTPSRQRADEWAVVLAAAGTPHWLRRRLDGWAVIVTPADTASALASLAAYDQENSRRARAATTRLHRRAP